MCRSGGFGGRRLVQGFFSFSIIIFQSNAEGSAPPLFEPLKHNMKVEGH
jgi:hypothetical protein